MRKFNRREHRILAITLAVAGLFAADRWIGLPIRNAWRELDHSIARKRSQLAHDQRLLLERDILKKAYAAHAPARRPGPADASPVGMTRVLRELETLAHSSRVKISDLKPQPLQSRNPTNPSVVLSVESNWPSLVHFIELIESSPQLLRIQRAGLRRQGDSPVLAAQLIIESRP